MPPLTPINVNISPKRVNGPDAFCRITGDPQYVQGGVIFIPPNGNYQLNFNLQTGGPALSWANQPFSSKLDDCPAQGDKAPGLTYLKTNGSVVEVEAKGLPSGKKVYHYALSFDDGSSTVHCDPIIIKN